MWLGLVMVITVVAHQQDTVTHKDSLPPPSLPAPMPAPVPPPVPASAPSIEQIRYMGGIEDRDAGPRTTA